MYVDTLPCDALCHYGNISEHLMGGSNLTQYWKRTKVYSPCTTKYKFVSDYCVLILILTAILIIVILIMFTYQKYLKWFCILIIVTWGWENQACVHKIYSLILFNLSHLLCKLNMYKLFNNWIRLRSLVATTLSSFCSTPCVIYKDKNIFCVHVACSKYILIPFKLIKPPNH